MKLYEWFFSGRVPWQVGILCTSTVLSGVALIGLAVYATFLDESTMKWFKETISLFSHLVTLFAGTLIGSFLSKGGSSDSQHERREGQS